ncbi:MULTISPECIES: hypothetical protein [unclassified Gemella]|nr:MULTISPECIES: hypothetical protein [unclassified Gemella]
MSRLVINALALYGLKKIIDFAFKQKPIKSSSIKITDNMISMSFN